MRVTKRQRASKGLKLVPRACISSSRPASRQIFLGDHVREKVRIAECKVINRKVFLKRGEEGRGREGVGSTNWRMELRKGQLAVTKAYMPKDANVVVHVLLCIIYHLSCIMYHAACSMYVRIILDCAYSSGESH